MSKSFLDFPFSFCLFTTFWPFSSVMFAFNKVSFFHEMTSTLIENFIHLARTLSHYVRRWWKKQSQALTLLFHEDVSCPLTIRLSFRQRRYLLLQNTFVSYMLDICYNMHTNMNFLNWNVTIEVYPNVPSIVMKLHNRTLNELHLHCLLFYTI